MCVEGGGSVVVRRSGQKEWSVAVMVVKRGGQSLLCQEEWSVAAASVKGEGGSQ